ncbi:MAG TPA: hydroxymethylbilane synthase [Rectinemataceae bacterium]|nr:hydroxymethylbilane synthase [Rectinemataceae bacterium]
MGSDLVRIGTRSSALARWQADWIRAKLQELRPGLRCAIMPISTAGDRILDRSLPEIGGKGVFTQELEAALASGEIDLAVHSLKDLPVESPPELTLGAVAEREDPRDVLVSARYATLHELPRGSRVGTSSPRRASQLLALRPDLALASLRGNVDTRIRKALEGEYDAIVLAAAGLVRLGRASAVSSYFGFGEMLPAPGQGALAVQCRAGDEAVLDLLGPVDHRPTRVAVAAERAFLRALGGGCSAPIAALGGFDGLTVALEGLVAARDGTALVRVRGSGADPEELGERLALEALGKGGRELLA